MNIQMGHLPEGDLVMVCDRKLPSDVRRVEYFRDQKLLNIVYEDEDTGEQLMHYEMPDDFALKVQVQSNVVIVEPDAATGKNMGYYASLIQVGT